MPPLTIVDSAPRVGGMYNILNCTRGIYTNHPLGGGRVAVAAASHLQFAFLGGSLLAY